MSQDLPFFSVIIPTYERPAQLTICLRALSRLDYPRERFEVIVINDGGAGPFGIVIEKLSGDLNLKTYAQRNTGPAGARNFGAVHALGEFLAFTDDDCEPDKSWLKALADEFSGDPDCLVGGRTINALAENPYAATSQQIIDVAYAHFNTDPQDARFFAANNIALAAKHFRELKGFDKSFITSEDRELCARWRSLGRRLSYAQDAVVYHSHELTLRALWRQHFGYGRGALRFHRAASNGRFKPDLVFYQKLLRACADRERSVAGTFRTGQSILLLFWSQLANAAGFFYEGYLNAIKASDFRKE
ncbi:MAG TPA: glycosyltransferase [Pyrinomonadaceae bacterium]|nr:glycosyltransferase [Pyrinomonadaceae bacterium]